MTVCAPNYFKATGERGSPRSRGEKLIACGQFMQYITSMRRCKGMCGMCGRAACETFRRQTKRTRTNENLRFRFIRGLAYANTTKFANESGQRQFMVEWSSAMTLQRMSCGRTASRLRQKAEASACWDEVLLRVSLDLNMAPRPVNKRRHGGFSEWDL